MKTLESLVATTLMHHSYALSTRIGNLLMTNGAEAQMDWVGAAVIAAGDVGLEIATEAEADLKWSLWRHSNGNSLPNPHTEPEKPEIDKGVWVKTLAPFAKPATPFLLGRRSHLEPTAGPEDFSIPLEPLVENMVREQIRLGLTKSFPAKNIIGHEIDWAE